MNEEDAKLLTPDERVAGYNAEHKATMAKYGIVLGAVPYVDDNGLMRARPALALAENVKMEAPEPVAPVEHVKG
jgi:hypothetical protein